MSIRRSAEGIRPAAYGRIAAAGAALALLLLTAAPPATAAGPSSGDGRSGAAGERPATAQQSVLRGGDPVYAPGRVCTLGFNTTDGSQDYGIASGRCISGAGTWYADAAMTVPVDSTAGTSFPGDDYGLIRYTNPDVAHPGEIDTSSGDPVRVTGSASPSVGSTVCHAGRVSGLQCGTVLAVNISVSHPEGTVDGLFGSNAHSEPGDAGRRPSRGTPRSASPSAPAAAPPSASRSPKCSPHTA